MALSRGSISKQVSEGSTNGKKTTKKQKPKGFKNLFGKAFPKDSKAKKNPFKNAKETGIKK